MLVPRLSVAIFIPAGAGPAIAYPQVIMACNVS